MVNTPSSHESSCDEGQQFTTDTLRRGPCVVRSDEFYDLLATSDGLPTTSQPSVGDSAETYRRLAVADLDILSIHMTSGLSGTFNAAQAAGRLVPEANITFVDTKTLPAAAGWQMEAAARALKASWPLKQILAPLERIGAASDSKGVVDRIAHLHPEGSALQVQVHHSRNPQGADLLRDLVDQRFDCFWLPVGPLSLVLGAHTGPSMIGNGYAPAAVFADMP